MGDQSDSAVTSAGCFSSTSATTNFGCSSSSSPLKFGQGYKSLFVDYTKYINRLTSFSQWPKGGIICPKSLARAGFYYTGSGDIVCCPFCHVRIGNFELFDEAFAEHKKFSRSCGYLQMVID